MLQVIQKQSDNTNLPFYVVIDQNGNEIYWAVTLDEANEYIRK